MDVACHDTLVTADPGLNAGTSNDTTPSETARKHSGARSARGCSDRQASGKAPDDVQDVSSEQAHSEDSHERVPLTARPRTTGGSVGRTALCAWVVAGNVRRRSRDFPAHGGVRAVMLGGIGHKGGAA
jgi:hypothetical protein